MRIALDGMGGDRAPAVVVEGALRSLEQAGPDADLEVVLVGRPEALQGEIDRLGGAPAGLSLHPASQVVAMDDAPGKVVRQMADSSIRVCFDLHKKGAADAVVSAGNSGATMASGVVVLGRLPGVDRPGLAGVLPGLQGPVVLIDVGANVDCTAEMLLQFAYMGAAYAERVLGKKRPRVGLLSIGEEGGKGNTMVKQAYEYLGQSDLNFVGNVEGRDLFRTTCQVVVCDGFVGNVGLKITEGLAEAAVELFVREITRTWTGRLSIHLMRPTLRRLRSQFDYATYGGAPLLGIKGVAFICHGASSAQAIASAVKLAAEAARNSMPRHLEQGLANFGRSWSGDGSPLRRAVNKRE